MAWRTSNTPSRQSTHIGAANGQASVFSSSFSKARVFQARDRFNVTFDQLVLKLTAKDPPGCHFLECDSPSSSTLHTTYRQDQKNSRQMERRVDLWRSRPRETMSRANQARIALLKVIPRERIAQ